MISGLLSLKRMQKSGLLRYQTLPRRQRVAALVGTASLALLLIYLLLLNPALTFRQHTR